MRANSNPYPYFDKAGYRRLLEVADDRDDIRCSFEEFERFAEAWLEQARRLGQAYERIVFGAADVDRILASLGEVNGCLDGRARWFFAFMAQLDRDEKAGHS